MWVQLLIFVLTIIGFFVFGKGEKNKKNRKDYIILVSVLLILQSGLRGVTVGTDTEAYYQMFINTILTSWNDIFFGFHQVYTLGEGKDAGYPFFMKVFQLLSTNYNVYLLFVATTFFFAFGRFLYLNTSSNRDVLLAVAIYQAVFYGFMSITGTRQTIAAAFTLFAFECIKNKAWIKFALLIFIASFIHKSCIGFVVAYIICLVPNSKLVLVGSSIGALLLFPFGKAFASFLVTISGTNNYMNFVNSDYETQGAKTFAIMMVGMLVLLLKYGNNLIKENDKNEFLLKTFSLAVLFTPFTWIDPSMMRLVQYFSIFIVILLPLIITQIEHSNSKIGKITYIFTLLFYIYITLGRQNYYVFFWE